MTTATRSRIALASLALASTVCAAQPARESSPGKYSGYSTIAYDGHRMTSQYVAALTTDADGMITVEVKGISTAVNGQSVRLVPYVGGVKADTATHMGQGINEWRCGPVTGLDKKYLPGSCRLEVN